MNARPLLLLFLLALHSPVLAQPNPASGTLEQRRSLRREVTRWLHARQTVLLPCEGCQGKGVVHRRRGGPGGLTSKEVRHHPCRGTGVVVRPRSLADLYRPYLPDAETFVGLGEARLTAEDLRAHMENEELSRQELRRKLIDELGWILGSARVTAMTFETAGERIAATVTTSVDPRETHWLLKDKRWYLVTRKDLEQAAQ
jgi:hypothetical protein